MAFQYVFIYCWFFVFISLCRVTGHFFFPSVSEPNHGGEIMLLGFCLSALILP